MAWDVKRFALGLLLSTVLITIISGFASSYLGTPILKTGTAFIIIFFAVFVTVIYNFSEKSTLGKEELFVIILLAGTLIGGFFLIKNYFPQIFSVFPDSTKSVFSAITG